MCGSGWIMAPEGGWEAPAEQQFLIVLNNYGRAFLGPPGKLTPALGGPPGDFPGGPLCSPLGFRWQAVLSHAFWSRF